MASNHQLAPSTSRELILGTNARAAVLLFDQNGRRIASVYFAQFGRGGTMNADSGTITGGLYQWAKSLMKGVAE